MPMPKTLTADELRQRAHAALHAMGAECSAEYWNDAKHDKTCDAILAALVAMRDETARAGEAREDPRVNALHARVTARDAENDRLRNALRILTENIANLWSNVREWRRLRACGSYVCDQIDRELRGFDTANKTAFDALKGA